VPVDEKPHLVEVHFLCLEAILQIPDAFAG